MPKKTNAAKKESRLDSKAKSPTAAVKQSIAKSSTVNKGKQSNATTVAGKQRSAVGAGGDASGSKKSKNSGDSNVAGKSTGRAKKADASKLTAVADTSKLLATKIVVGSKRSLAKASTAAPESTGNSRNAAASAAGAPQTDYSNMKYPSMKNVRVVRDDVHMVDPGKMSTCHMRSARKTVPNK